MPSEHHHDVRRRVRPHAGKGEERGLELGVGKRRGRRRRERLEIELAIGDRPREPIR